MLLQKIWMSLIADGAMTIQIRQSVNDTLQGDLNSNPSIMELLITRIFKYVMVDSVEDFDAFMLR